jgi:hypothetical protein
MLHITTRAVRSALFSAVLATLAGAAVADSRTLPFKASLKLSESITFTGAAPCFAIGQLSGTGQASHLGKVTASSQDCINPDGVFDPNGPTSYHFVSGQGAAGLVFTGAAGDQLFASYSGALTARGRGPHGVSGHFVITGGTGRFAGAVGGGVIWGHEDISQVVLGTGQIELLGTVSY